MLRMACASALAFSREAALIMVRQLISSSSASAARQTVPERMRVKRLVAKWFGSNASSVSPDKDVSRRNVGSAGDRRAGCRRRRMDMINTDSGPGWRHISSVAVNGAVVGQRTHECFCTVPARREDLMSHNLTTTCDCSAIPVFRSGNGKNAGIGTICRCLHRQACGKDGGGCT